MYKIRSLFCALLALTLLAGCGFHLRQSATVPSALQPIYLGGKAGFGALAQQLRIMLTRDEMALSATAAGARYQLLIQGEYQQRRIVSLDRRGLIAELGLITGATFELYDNTGKLVLGPQVVEERRTIVNNPDNVITTNEEERISREEMTKALAANILRRISAYKPPAAPPEAAGAASAPVPATAD